MEKLRDEVRDELERWEYLATALNVPALEKTYVLQVLDKLERRATRDQARANAIQAVRRWSQPPDARPDTIDTSRADALEAAERMMATLAEQFRSLER